jgi:hypothetical protein
LSDIRDAVAPGVAASHLTREDLEHIGALYHLGMPSRERADTPAAMIEYMSDAGPSQGYGRWIADLVESRRPGA